MTPLAKLLTLPRYTIVLDAPSRRTFFAASLAEVRALVARVVREADGRRVLGRVHRANDLHAWFVSTRGRPARFTRGGA